MSLHYITECTNCGTSPTCRTILMHKLIHNLRSFCTVILAENENLTIAMVTQFPWLWLLCCLPLHVYVCSCVDEGR